VSAPAPARNKDIAPSSLDPATPAVELPDMMNLVLLPEKLRRERRMPRVRVCIAIVFGRTKRLRIESRVARLCVCVVIRHWCTEKLEDGKLCG
jgi:hypothetical protein